MHQYIGRLSILANSNVCAANIQLHKQHFMTVFCSNKPVWSLKKHLIILIITPASALRLEEKCKLVLADMMGKCQPNKNITKQKQKKQQKKTDSNILVHFVSEKYEKVQVKGLG